MSTGNIILKSTDGAAVTLPADTAWNCVDLLNALKELDGGSDGEVPPIVLNFPGAVLGLVADYLRSVNKKAKDTPKASGSSSPQKISAPEMKFVRGVERIGLLVPLIHCACYLRILVLRDLLCSYVAQRIEEISAAVPSVMEAAEAVRQLLQIPDEWTAEEKNLLEIEMQNASVV